MPPCALNAPRNLAGFCAVTNTLQRPKGVEVEASISVPAVNGTGMNAAFDKTVHCIAAEPCATIVRVAVTDDGKEVAFETAILGQLRNGYR
eukprot:2974764-Prymnesium_polylepis.1